MIRNTADMWCVVDALKDHVRVNVTLKTVEIYNDFGVQMVLRDLDDSTFDAFCALFTTY